MTRARRITQGERTHAERRIEEGSPHAEPYDTPADPEPQVLEEQEGEPRVMPQRMCKSCEKLAEPDTAYGLIQSSTGLGHFWLQGEVTLCGADTTDWDAGAFRHLRRVTS